MKLKFLFRNLETDNKSYKLSVSPSGNCKRNFFNSQLLTRWKEHIFRSPLHYWLDSEQQESSSVFSTIKTWPFCFKLAVHRHLCDQSNFSVSQPIQKKRLEKNSIVSSNQEDYKELYRRRFLLQIYHSGFSPCLFLLYSSVHGGRQKFLCPMSMVQFVSHLWASMPTHKQRKEKRAISRSASAHSLKCFRTVDNYK